MRRKGYARGRYVPLIKPSLLANALKAWVGTRFDGSIARAAASARVAESTLRRLLLSRNTWVREEVLERLGNDMKVDSSFWSAILTTDDASTDLACHQRWIQEARERIVRATGLSPGTHTHGILLINRLGWRDLLWKVVSVRLPHVRNEMNELAEVHGGPRLALAFERMVEPLLDAECSNFVEYAGLEMKPGAFARFIECSWEREKILLQDTDPATRVRKRELAMRRRTRPKRQATQGAITKEYFWGDPVVNKPASSGPIDAALQSFYPKWFPELWARLEAEEQSRAIGR